MAKFVCNNFVVSLWESQSSPAKAKCVDAFNLQIPSPMTALHKRFIVLRKRLIEKNCVVQDMQGKFCVASTKKKGAATHDTPASDVDSCQLESPSEITTEDGIKRNFNDYDHAYEYACESTGRSYLHNFQHNGHGQCKCCNCDSRRKLSEVKIDGTTRYLVVGIGLTTHTTRLQNY